LHGIKQIDTHASQRVINCGGIILHGAKIRQYNGLQT
jgi:hypothetical protein